MSRQRAFLWTAARSLLAAVAVMVVIDAAAWFFVCQRLEQGTREAVAAAGANGWVITTAEPVRAGWPIAAELRIPAVAVSGDPALVPEAIGWSAETVRLRLRLFDPTKLHALAAGGQSVRAGRLGPFAYTAATTDFVVPLIGAAPPLLKVRSLDAEGWTVASLDAAFPPDAAEVATEGVAPPAQLWRGLPDVSLLRFRAALTRSVPPGPSPARKAQLWRDAGGTLEVTRLQLEWGTLTATGQITFHLDENLQPDGTGSLEVVGLRPALDALAKAGVLRPQTATAARAVLALLGGSDPEKPLRLPLRVRRGLVEVAGFPLLRLAPVDWGPV